MKSFLKQVVVGLLAVTLTAPAAFAQDRVPFRQEELDQMLAPIALYPDSLLSQILMAATYPLEVVQASRWSRANAGTKGQDAVRAVESKDWDPSVKSLTAFPQILTMMDEKIEWTERLGEAFLAQQADVMDSVQALRRRAEAAGNLRSSDQMQVAREGEFITIRQPAPEVIYVPYYNPAVVYGPWWWPAYPPFYWGPPAGYYAGYWPGFYWGSGIVISTGFFFGYTNWNQRQVTVVNNNVVVNRTSVGGRPHAPVVWQHNPVHRRGVSYRHAVLPQPFGQPPTSRSNERSRPLTAHERSAQPDPRNAAPQTRGLPAATRPRSERFTPQAGDRILERSAHTENQHLQSRGREPRPAVVTPFSGAAPHPVAPATVARSDPRPYPPAARAAPRRESEPAQRAGSLSSIRESFMTPRVAASAPAHVPLATGGHAIGGASAHGGGNPRAMSTVRGGGRS